MKTKPGEVYRVDLGMGGKVRMMMVVSREDAAAPRALSICAPITTANRGSAYEVELPSRPFLRERSYANIQGLQAIQHHERQGPIGIFHGKVAPLPLSDSAGSGPAKMLSEYCAKAGAGLRAVRENGK